MTNRVVDFFDVKVEETVYSTTLKDDDIPREDSYIILPVDHTKKRYQVWTLNRDFTRKGTPIVIHIVPRGFFDKKKKKKK